MRTLYESLPVQQEGLFQHRVSEPPPIFAHCEKRLSGWMTYLDSASARRIGSGGWTMRSVMASWLESKRTNRRDLNLKRPPPRDLQIPVYQVETNPPPNSKEPVPIERRAARRRTFETVGRDGVLGRSKGRVTCSDRAIRSDVANDWLSYVQEPRVCTGWVISARRRFEHIFRDIGSRLMKEGITI